MESSIDLRTLNKVLLLCQKNSKQLCKIEKQQEKLEGMLNGQKLKFCQNLKNGMEVKKGKNTKENKNRNDFYQVNICFNIITLFMLFINLIYITGSDSKVGIQSVSRT